VHKFPDGEWGWVVSGCPVSQHKMLSAKRINNCENVFYKMVEAHVHL